MYLSHNIILDQPYTKTRCPWNFKPIIRSQEKVISFYTKQNSHVPEKTEEKQRQSPSTDSVPST